MLIFAKKLSILSSSYFLSTAGVTLKPGVCHMGLQKTNLIWLNYILYFFGYKTEFFSFQNNPKDVGPSCKMDLDLWDCLGRVKLVV